MLGIPLRVTFDAFGRHSWRGGLVMSAFCPRTPSNCPRVTVVSKLTYLHSTCSSPPSFVHPFWELLFQIGLGWKHTPSLSSRVVDLALF